MDHLQIPEAWFLEEIKKYINNWEFKTITFTCMTFLLVLRQSVVHNALPKQEGWLRSASSCNDAIMLLRSCSPHCISPTALGDNCDLADLLSRQSITNYEWSLLNPSSAWYSTNGKIWCLPPGTMLNVQTSVPVEAWSRDLYQMPSFWHGIRAFFTALPHSSLWLRPFWLMDSLQMSVQSQIRLLDWPDLTLQDLGPVFHLDPKFCSWWPGCCLVECHGSGLPLTCFGDPGTEHGIICEENLFLEMEQVLDMDSPTWTRCGAKYQSQYQGFWAIYCS